MANLTMYPVTSASNAKRLLVLATTSPKTAGLIVLPANEYISTTIVKSMDLSYYMFCDSVQFGCNKESANSGFNLKYKIK